MGKSGARRQVDVLITHKTKLHTYTTLVECKKWKEKVDRSVVDVLYAAIEDLNASKGVIFTTSGYEEGAEKYASSKNIDIFVVRELTQEEWGLPGEIIHFYMHLIAGNLSSFSMPNAQMVPLIEEYPTSLNIDIVIDKDKKMDESLSLYSVKNGEKGVNLIQLLWQKQGDLLHLICNSIPLLEDGNHEANLVILSEIELDFSNYEFRQLRLKYGAVNINKIQFKLITHLSQTLFHYDRSENFDIALTIENYIKRQIHIISKSKVKDNISMTDNLFDKLVKDKIIKDGQVLENNSILKVYCDPTVKIDLKGNERTATTEKIYIKL